MPAAGCIARRTSERRGRTRSRGTRRPRALAGGRGRGPARAFGAADLAAVLATGRSVESDEVALERGPLDAVIAGLLVMAGMRRSELSALRWADVADAAEGDGSSGPPLRRSPRLGAPPRAGRRRWPPRSRRPRPTSSRRGSAVQMTAQEKEAVSERMKASWAERRKNAAK